MTAKRFVTLGLALCLLGMAPGRAIAGDAEAFEQFAGKGPIKDLDCRRFGGTPVDGCIKNLKLQSSRPGHALYTKRHAYIVYVNPPGKEWYNSNEHRVMLCRFARPKETAALPKKAR